MGSISHPQRARRRYVKKSLSPRLAQLEAEFVRSGGRWKEVQICSYFEKVKTKSLKYSAHDLKNKHDDIFCLPALTAGVENQGLAYYVPRQDATILSNMISVSGNGANTGVMFYQPHDFTVLQDSYAIRFIGKELSSRAYLYLVSALQKSIRYRFDWSNKAGWERIKEEPITLPFSADGELDFPLMERYIAELEAERVAELEAYLTVSGLRDTELTAQENALLQSINSKMGGVNGWRIAC